MREFITERWTHILADSWQHLSLVVQCLILATIIAVVCAALSYQHPRLAALANNVSTVGLTIPSFALVGILIIPFGFGVLPAVIVVTFFATLPILRNAVVGLSEVDSNIVSAARGIGMSIAAVAAYALGPGLGGYIFSGLSRLGGANSFESVATGVIAVVILALLLDLALILLGRFTISRGIRV